MSKTEKTYTVFIYMAGDITEAARTTQLYVMDVGLCVTIEPLDFIYTGGKETGFRVGLLNYPKFPKEPEEILGVARGLANRLRGNLAQHSWLLVTPDITEWDTKRNEPDGD